MVRNLTALLVFSATVSIASLAPGQADPGAGRRATPAPEASRADAETRRAQQDLKEILAEIRGRMTSLAERLKATQPEDAKRLDEAARKIETSQLPQDLAAIIDNLTNQSFFKALNLQDGAIQKLEEVIRILEARRFGDNKELQKRFDDAARLRQELSRVRQGEESLIKKAQKFLQTAKDLAGLKDLGKQVDELARQQEAVLRGEDLSAQNPEADDARTIEQAKSAVEALRQQQEELNRELQKLAGGDSREGAAGEKNQAGEKTPPSGGKLAEAKRQMEALLGEVKSLQGETSKAAGGGDSKTKNEPGEIPPADRERLSKNAEGIAGKLGDLEKSLQTPGEAEASSPEAAKAAEKAAEKVADAARKLAEAKGDLEKGDSGKALSGEQAAQKALEEAREALAAGPEKGEPSAPSDPGSREAASKQEKIAQSTQEASQAMRRDGSKTGNPKAGQSLKAGSEALDEAKKAMEAAQAALEGKEPSPGEENSSGENSGQEKSGQAKSKSSQTASAGKKAQAAKSGQEAAEALKKAAEALAQGEKDLAARSAAEKAADLQKKLGKKTEEAEKRAAELEKKLRRKAEEKKGLSGARESLARAARSMQESAEARRAGREQEARAKSQEALDRLQKAQEEMAKEDPDQLLRMEKEKLAQQAREQDELKQMTKKLAKDLAGSRDSAGASKGAEQAAQKMQEAQDELAEEDAESAKKKEEEALERLQQAEQAALKEEDQLARLKQEQELINIKAELREVKSSQEEINTQVVDLNKKRGNAARLTRTLSVAVKKQSESEKQLSERVDGLTTRLEEEIARVFAYVLRNIGSDMKQLSDDLADQETGEPTQFLGKEVVKSLDRLLESLEQLKKQPPPDDGNQQGGQQPLPGRRRMVPAKAELIMLKDLQVEVNRRTEELNLQRDAAKGEAWDRMVKRLVQRQGSLTDMTSKIAEDLARSRAAAAQEGEEEEEQDAHGKPEGGEAGKPEAKPVDEGGKKND